MWSIRAAIHYLRLPISQIAARLRPWVPACLRGGRIESAARASLRRIDRLIVPHSVLAARDVFGKSMLHPETLVALYEIARACDGAIVEIGACVGGATVVMAKAAQRAGSRSPIIAIEVGGVRPDPEHLPSADIIADLRSNLIAHGVADRVQIIQGWSNAVVHQVARTLGSEKIALLLIDADGAIDRDFPLYSEMLAANAHIVIDDFIAPGNIKAETVHPWVIQKMALCVLEQTEVRPWGTWFGRYRG